jgi:hypothetical protein
LKKDQMFARSGIQADTAEVVEFEVAFQETARQVAREPLKPSQPG